MAAARTAGPGGVDGHVGRPGTEDPVDRPDGLQALGEPEPDPVAPARPHRASRVASRSAASRQGRERQRPAVLVFHGRVIRPAGGRGVQ